MLAILNQPPALVPPLQGWVSSFYRTYKGKRLGPYHVRRWKVGSSIKRQYVKPQDLEQVRLACNAHRARKRKQSAVGAWLTDTWANLEYMRKMVRWSYQGKVRSQDLDYMNRLEKEGFDITGRPSTRRKITRAFARVDGQTVLVKTVLELDGTTKVFMVPFFANDCFLTLEDVRNMADDVWEAAEGNRKSQTPLAQTSA